MPDKVILRPVIKEQEKTPETILKGMLSKKALDQGIQWFTSGTIFSCKVKI